jgi:hypothetical protein
LACRRAAGRDCVYHIGYLARDRNSESNRKSAEQMAIDQTVVAAWQAQTEGTVQLAQKRLGIGQFNYIATRKSPPTRAAM